MSHAAATPEEEIAGTLGDLSQQTRNLVRREIESARLEMLEGAKRGAPVIVSAMAAGVCGRAAVLG
jgi:hypothetical protein